MPVDWCFIFFLLMMMNRDCFHEHFYFSDRRSCAASGIIQLDEGICLAEADQAGMSKWEAFLNKWDRNYNCYRFAVLPLVSDQTSGACSLSGLAYANYVEDSHDPVK
jgi:hypothetical protein